MACASEIVVAPTPDGDRYGLSVAGPAERIRQHCDAHAALLVDAKARLLTEQGHG